MTAEEVEALPGVAEDKEKEYDVAKAVRSSEECAIDVAIWKICSNRHVFEDCLSHAGRLTSR